MPYVASFSFTSKPNKFSETVANGSYSIVGNPTVTVNTDYKYIKIEPVEALTNGVGYGIIDNNNRLVAYFNKTIKAGNLTDPIYFMFRKYQL